MLPADGFTGDVSLSFEGPAGVSGVLDPPLVPGGSGVAQLRVRTDPTTAPGSYRVTVAGVSGTRSHNATADLTVSAPAPADRIELSTVGSGNPPALAGPADDADVLLWDGTAFSRSIDASLAPYRLPSSADLDGFSRVDATRFYASLSEDTRVPGLGMVQDEDVIFFDGAAWSVWFDGTGQGMTSNAQDLDAISVVGSTLYFSTLGSGRPPGVSGAVDDADVYRWNGRSFARVWDASAAGLGKGADVDGLDLADPSALLRVVRRPLDPRAGPGGRRGRGRGPARHRIVVTVLRRVRARARHGCAGHRRVRRAVGARAGPRACTGLSTGAAALCTPRRDECTAHQQICPVGCRFSGTALLVFSSRA